MSEPRIDWTTAEVRDGRLSVNLEGDLPSGWKKSFETVAHLLEHGDVSTVKLKKHTITIEARAGEEEKVRHFLESVVLQANADHRPPEEDESDEDDEEPVEVRLSGDQQPDAEMADRFRAFGGREPDAA